MFNCRHTPAGYHWTVLGLMAAALCVTALLVFNALAL